ncbi:MAG: SDR family oxidoreductase [Longimicrobiales bacterium]
MEQITRNWALLAAPYGVRVNAVAPGPTETGILEASGLDAVEVETIVEEEQKAIPMGRRGRPEEVARWIAHLADPAAGWVTGEIIAVDGGLGLT